MSSRRVPLSLLDLSPIVSGATAGDALRNSIDLARHAEAAGYHRYWIAEHHFTPGVASSAPAILIGQVAAATTTIRVGSGAVQTGHQTALSIVEQFGMLAALFPDRIDLGLGRSGQRRKEAIAELAAAKAAARGSETKARPERTEHVVDGLLIPKPFSYAKLFGSSRLGSLLGQLPAPGAETPDYTEQVAEVLGLIEGSRVTADGVAINAVPGEGADVEVWIFGSSKGESARVAGANGLPFAANYHVSPATVLEAIDAYRNAFRPSEHLAEPHVAVSADVVVADDDATARRLASPHALWVRSIRTGQGAIPFPTPDEAARHPWSESDRELVADRVDTQFVGAPETVVAGLETLTRVTGADELVVTTVTHDHRDRVRSHELLAEHWLAASRPAPRSDAIREAAIR
jgi:alkanesulfonate monooxygenase SsuD/methylene tetrahydromethanopterin reductase-like flavin-dependent oxidoreductase (luciferase family)